MRAGDTRVAGAFHDRVRPQVERSLRRLYGHDESDFDDLRQLVLIELVFTIGQFRGECSLDGWVRALTSHVVWKHLRKKRSERRFLALLTREDLFPRSILGTPREAMVRNLLRQTSRYLEGMDPNKAWAFVLHDLLGHDLRETAQIMSITVTAAQTRLVRGRKELHLLLGADSELATLLEELDQWP